MSSIRLSVIIPIYNAEQHLNACILSVLSQTYSNLEILLIDDGSSDSSGAICDHYAQKDNRIQVIHKKNGGVSSARNAGLRAASGDYICFIDADDWIEADLFSLCLHNLSQYPCDVLQHATTMDIWNHNTIQRSILISDFSASGFLTQEQLAKYLPSSWTKIALTVYNYIFKKELLTSLFFDESMPYAEDTTFVFQALSRASTYFFLSERGYHYNVRMGSAAFRWQPTILDCFQKLFYMNEQFCQKFNLSQMDFNRIMSIQKVNAYSDILYKMCLPTCTLTLRQKLSFAKHARKILDINRCQKYYLLKEKSLFERLKLISIFCHLECILLAIGKYYVG